MYKGQYSFTQMTESNDKETVWRIMIIETILKVKSLSSQVVQIPSERLGVTCLVVYVRWLNKCLSDYLGKDYCDIIAYATYLII